jgi:DnaJ homolog subfamily B member 13
MVKNYYKVLEVSTTSTTLEIQEGYKRAILKWHPNKTKYPASQASKEFAEASEAYEVLSTPSLRAVYDAYGYEKLVSGIQKNGEIIFPAYEFKSNQVYNKYVLEANPFVNIIDTCDSKCRGSMFGFSALGKHWNLEEPSIDIKATVSCTLEELYIGCTKQLKFTRLVLDPNRITTHEVACTKDIIIKPGYSHNMEIVYKGEGSEKMNCRPGDLILKILESKHTKFERKGNDLHVVIRLGLHEALTSTSIKIENLDRTIQTISINYCINPQHVITLPGRGMPILDSLTKGNLCVHFDIVFPERIPETHLDDLRSLLPN